MNHSNSEGGTVSLTDLLANALVINVPDMIASKSFAETLDPTPGYIPSANIRITLISN